MKKMKRLYRMIIVAILLSGFGHAASAAESNTPEWSPELATGAPDTSQARGIPTAWSSRQPDSGTKWLQPAFEQPVQIADERISEAFNPRVANLAFAQRTSAKAKKRARKDKYKKMFFELPELGGIPKR